jgi:hypothetical protein
MAEVSQYTFNWSEVAEALIKKQDIHDGQWMAIIEFAVTGGVFGQTPGDARPGMMVNANGVQLLKAPAGAAPHLVVDATKVNPAS